MENRHNRIHNPNGIIKNKKKNRFSDLLYRSGFYNYQIFNIESYTFVTSYLIEVEEESREDTDHHLIPTKYLPEKFWTK